MKTTSSVEYTYLGYLHHQVFSEKSWPTPRKRSGTSLSLRMLGFDCMLFQKKKMQLCTRSWYTQAHPEFEICKGADKLLLTHPSFTSGTPVLILSAALRDTQIKTSHAALCYEHCIPIKKFFSVTLLLSTL